MKREKTAFVLVDIQEKFRPVIQGFDKVVGNVNKLVKGAEILKVPLIVTEQNPEKLGGIVEEIELPEVEKISKMHFSCFGVEEFVKRVEGFEVLVFFGIEAHVCILKTALDGIEKGFEVHVVADAVSSRNLEDKEIAIERMRQGGVFVDSTEIILFQLMEKAGTDEFRGISEIIK